MQKMIAGDDMTFEVDGKKVKCPSKLEWALQDISKSNAGRTKNALMHKNRIAQKRTLNLGWNGVTDDECHEILKAFNPEYVDIKFYDPLEGKVITKNFYTGDKTAPVYSWWVGKHLYQSVSFSAIER